MLQTERLPFQKAIVVLATPPSDHVFSYLTSIVSRSFGLDEKALSTRTRGAPQAAFARQVAMYLANVGFAMNFATIGRMFGRDRTTVAHACHVVEDRRDDALLDRRLTTLEQACRQYLEWQAIQPSNSAVRDAQ